MYYYPCIFCDPKFWCVFLSNFFWTSVKTLSMKSVVPSDQNTHFWRSKRAPKKVNLSFCWFSCAIIYNLFWWSGISTYVLPKFFVDVRLHISYEASWPWRPKWSIFKVKRASKYVYPILSIFMYYSLWNFWWSRISTSLMPKYFMDGL